MIRNFDDKVFVLDTKNTTYAFRVMDTGQLEHLYYGKKITIDSKEDVLSLIEQHAFAPGCTANYTNEDRSFTLDDMRLEVSSMGKSDLREPFIEMVHSDGSRTCDFLFMSAEALNEKSKIKTLPSSYFEDGSLEENEKGESVELRIDLVDEFYKQKLSIFYDVFYDKDVITRRAVLKNEGDSSIQLLR